MNATWSVLLTELPGWVLRGTLCALPSFTLALGRGFRHPAEIGGMIAGTAIWIFVVAWFSAYLVKGRKRGREEVQLLKQAVWIRFGCSLAGDVLARGIYAVSPGWLDPPENPLAIYARPDVWQGIVARELVNRIGGFYGDYAIATLDSFGWTCLTTLVAGGVFAVGTGLSAIALIAFRWLRSSPVN